MKNIELTTLLIVLLVSLTAGCRLSVRSSSTVPSPPRVLNQDITEELRARYDKGFARVVASLPEDAESSPYGAVWLIARFKGQNVAWAGLRGNAYYAIESGPWPAGWLAVVPPGNFILSHMNSALDIDPSTTINVLRIKPDKVTELWAGLFLVHGLSHLADRVTGVEPPDATHQQYLMGELRAYNLVLLAASLVSGGVLDRHLDEVLGCWRPVSIEGLADRLQAMDSTDIAYLDSSVPAGSPESEAEATLRADFYRLTLALRYAEVHYELAIEPTLRIIDDILSRLTTPN